MIRKGSFRKPIDPNRRSFTKPGIAAERLWSEMTPNNAFTKPDAPETQAAYSPIYSTPFQRGAPLAIVKCATMAAPNFHVNLKRSKLELNACS